LRASLVVLVIAVVVVAFRPVCLCRVLRALARLLEQLLLLVMYVASYVGLFGMVVGEMPSLVVCS